MREDLENNFCIHALPVRRERLPASALQRGLATWARPRSPSFACPPHRCCSTEPSLVTAIKTHQTTLLLQGSARGTRSQQLIAGLRSFAVCYPLLGSGLLPFHRGVVFPSCPVPYHQSTGRATLSTRWTHEGRHHQVAERRRWQPQARCALW